MGRINPTPEQMAAIKTAITERLTELESLEDICRDPAMPSRMTVWIWRNQDPEFNKAYEAAQRVRAEALLDETLAIADDSRADYVTKPDGSTQVNWENVQRSKLRVDVRKMLAANLAPDLYGERVTQTIQGKVEHEHTMPAVTDEMRKNAILSLFRVKIEPSLVDALARAHGSHAENADQGLALATDHLARIGNSPKPADPLEELSRGGK